MGLPPVTETDSVTITDSVGESNTETTAEPVTELEVRKVSTRSSTRRNKPERRKALGRTRKPSRRKERKESSSSSDPETPVANAEKGVDLPFTDISADVRKEVEEAEAQEPEVIRKVRFSEEPTIVGSSKPIRVDEYDILQDIKSQKANVTIGQLLHDNANYQKQVRDACIHPRRRRIRLPEVAVNF